MRPLVLLALLLTACGDDSGSSGSMDLSSADLPISLPDLSACQLASFTGFPGDSPTERRLDCACGCLIDSLDGAATSGLWARSSAGATLTDSAEGVAIVTDGVSGPAFASLASLNVAGPFYLDGDFDLRVDYLISLFNPATHVSLRVTAQDGTFYEIARTRSSLGADAYTTELGGASVSATASVSTGTLRLARSGTTIVGYGDATMVAQTLVAQAGRVSIALAAGIDGCFAGDGGSCTLVSSFADVRLTTGALVDRR
jgi:hypothetical protein